MNPTHTGSHSTSSDQVDGTISRRQGDMSNSGLEVFLARPQDLRMASPPHQRPPLADSGPVGQQVYPNTLGFLVPPNLPYGQPQHSFMLSITSGRGAFITADFVRSIRDMRCNNVTPRFAFHTPRKSSFLVSGKPVDITSVVKLEFLLKQKHDGGWVLVTCYAWVTPDSLDRDSRVDLWLGEDLFVSRRGIPYFAWMSGPDDKSELAIMGNHWCGPRRTPLDSGTA